VGRIDSHRIRRIDLPMITIYSDAHFGHDPESELLDGRLQRIYERPERAQRVIDAVREARIGEVRDPAPCTLDPILRVHEKGLVRFLEQARGLWKAQIGTHDAMPFAHYARGMSVREPESINGKLAFYALDAVTPLTDGSFEASVSAVAVALSGLQLIRAGERAAFSLCRPPGHHSMRGQYGGYGLFNNVAVAAQAALDAGASRVAVLDVDYHHGNGTQDIFYDRSDVLYVSIHADPRYGYPFFMGHADEAGVGQGTGFNLNMPLPHGTRWDTYRPALAAAIQRVREYSPDILFVSLGVDTFDGDPAGNFKLQTADYLPMGAAIASLKRPTVFVMEGGYHIEALGRNTVNVLKGFEGG
jgi:acetoin utilization deacetylase AcuC-like enzyme